MIRSFKPGSILALVLLAVVAVRGTAVAASETTLDPFDRATLKQYQDLIDQKVHALRLTLADIQANPVLHQALADRDRETLLKEALPLFERIRRDEDITHFYFHTPALQNLLRVHQPDRHGDNVRRFTAGEAISTGAESYGVELGPMGTLTLRMVVPWYATGTREELIGLVELGVDIDRLFDRLEMPAGRHPMLLVRKDLLLQPTWEAGRRMVGEVPWWDRFPDIVLTGMREETFPDNLEEYLRGTTWANWGDDQDHQIVADGNRAYRTHFIPIPDVRGRTIGQLMVFEELRGLQAPRNQHLAVGGVTALLLLAGVLLATRRRVR